MFLHTPFFLSFFKKSHALISFNFIYKDFIINVVSRHKRNNNIICSFVKYILNLL
nr:MAG TPA: hypothetical protein [Caudoviricetes sp.]